MSVGASTTAGGGLAPSRANVNAADRRPRDWRRQFAPLWLPFMLSWLPVAAVLFERRLDRQAGVEQRLAQFERDAVSMLEEIRVGFEVERYVQRGLARWRRDWLAAAANRSGVRSGSDGSAGDRSAGGRQPGADGDSDLGRRLVTGFRRSFPDWLQPADTVVYAFRCPRGGSAVGLRAPGLAVEKLRILGELATALALPDLPDAERLRVLDRRIAGVFGDDLRFSTHATERRGRLTPVCWAGREAVMTWEVFDPGESPAVSTASRTIAGFDAPGARPARTGVEPPAGTSLSATATVPVLNHDAAAGAGWSVASGRADPQPGARFAAEGWVGDPVLVLVVWPMRVVTGDAPGVAALAAAHRVRPSMLPLLLPPPTESGAGQVAPLAPPGATVPASLLPHLSAATVSEHLPGHRFQPAAGWWAVRGRPAPDRDEPILVVAAADRLLGAAAGGGPGWNLTRADAGLPVGVMLVWIGVFAWCWRLGPRFALSVRQRMLLDLGGLAAVSLSSLYLVASAYMQLSYNRAIDESVREVVGGLAAVDADSAAVSGALSRAGRRLLRSPAWCAALFSGRSVRRDRALQLAARRFASPEVGMPLQLLGVFDLLRGHRLGWIPPGTPRPRRVEATLNYLTPLIEGTSVMIGTASGAIPWGAELRDEPGGPHGLEPGTRSEAVGVSPGGAEMAETAGPLDSGRRVSPRRDERGGVIGARAIAATVRSSLDPAAFERFLHRRLLADVFEMRNRAVESEPPLLMLYDFVIERGALRGAVAFGVDATTAAGRYLTAGVSALATSGRARRCAVARLDGSRSVPLHPGPAFWRRSVAARFRSILAAVARTGARQIEVGADGAVVAIPTTIGRGFALAAAVSFRPIRRVMVRRQRWLWAAMAAMCVAMVLLGETLVQHLLAPLAMVEHGLRCVAAGDLTVRLGLARDDELGELSRAFDAMIRGVAERQELGWFVSGTLDAAVSDARQLGGLECRCAAVLVSDMRNFTTIAESQPPRALVTMLNQHHQTMAATVLANGGVVEQFIGDALVAVFDDDAAGGGSVRAVATAVAMMQAHAGLVQARQRRGEFAYRIGIGIDRGEVLSGSIGTGQRREFTVLGVPRDRAEELEARTKQGRHSLIMVSPTVAGFGKGVPGWRFEPVLGADALELAIEETVG